MPRQSSSNLSRAVNVGGSSRNELSSSSGSSFPDVGDYDYSNTNHTRTVDSPLDDEEDYEEEEVPVEPPTYLNLKRLKAMQGSHCAAVQVSDDSHGPFTWIDFSIKLAYFLIRWVLFSVIGIVCCYFLTLLIVLISPQFTLGIARGSGEEYQLYRVFNPCGAHERTNAELATLLASWNGDHDASAAAQTTPTTTATTQETTTPTSMRVLGLPAPVGQASVQVEQPPVQSPQVLGPSVEPLSAPPGIMVQQPVLI